MRARGRRFAAAAAAGVVVAAACAGAVASAPPSIAPSVNQQNLIEGSRILVAARAARALQEFGFTTRRFSADSTWGYRAPSRTSARLRYVQSSNDSTRVLIELWLPCGTAYGCGRTDAATLVQRLQLGEETPESR